MVKQIISNVPHMQGKSDEIMSALMACGPLSFEYGNEKFWMILYLPGLFGLETMDRGEHWNRPRMSSICCCKNGPSYLPVSNSCLTVSWNTSLNVEMLSSLSGVNVLAMYLIAALKPYCKLVGMCLYLLCKLLD